MGSLAKKLEKGPLIRPRLGSAVDRFLNDLDDEDREATLAAMRDPDWTHAELNQRLSEDGLTVSDQQFAKARRRHGFAR